MNSSKVSIDLTTMDYVPQIPDSTEYLDISLSDKSITAFPKYLKHLVISAKSICQLPTFPDELISIYIHNLTTDKLPPLPYSLKSLKFYNVRLQEFPDLPEGLCELVIKKSIFPKINSFPTSLEFIKIKCQYIDLLPDLPEALEILICTDTTLCKLPLLPTNLKCVILFDNFINEPVRNYLKEYEESEKFVYYNNGYIEGPSYYCYGKYADKKVEYGPNEPINIFIKQVNDYIKSCKEPTDLQ